MSLLTDKEIWETLRDDYAHSVFTEHVELARAIEAKILEKLNSQEPFAYGDDDIDGEGSKGVSFDPLSDGFPLYARPIPQYDVVKDAERYRWLRNEYTTHPAQNTSIYDYLSFGDGKELDAVIDAAIGEKK